MHPNPILAIRLTKHDSVLTEAWFSVVDPFRSSNLLSNENAPTITLRLDSTIGIG
jgi:hypothetical protein